MDGRFTTVHRLRSMDESSVSRPSCLIAADRRRRAERSVLDALNWCAVVEQTLVVRRNEAQWLVLERNAPAQLSRAARAGVLGTSERSKIERRRAKHAGGWYGAAVVCGAVWARRPLHPSGNGASRFVAAPCRCVGGRHAAHGAMSGIDAGRIARCGAAGPCPWPSCPRFGER